MSLSNSTSLVRVKKRFDPKHDTCVDKVTDQKRYTLKGNAFKYEHAGGRPLPNDVAERATTYIRAIVKKYPFQLRYAFALSYWKRFSEAWCNTGDEEKSLRSI